MPSKPPHKGEGHRRRLRERFLADGLRGFHDYEVVELLLTLATPRKDCKDAAKAALQRFKTLQGVLEAPDRSLQQVDGIGPKNVFGLRLIKAVADRYLEKKLIGTDPVRNSQELFDFLYHRIRDTHRERFLALFLDAKNRITDIETLFIGTLTGSSVYPREVVAAALERHAAAVIFAHNHPSGEPEPSAEDMALTRQLVFACGLAGITVHEHLIVGNNRYFSFADHGYIRRIKEELDRFVATGAHFS
ncbi:MAG: DNA repair protein RadC [Desulfobacterales bacterium]|nr:DNA repair protein RadC [Desulfobacterales bacterium]